MKNWLAALFASALFSVANLSFCADWPFFYGPDKNGISKEKDLNLDWKKKKPEEIWRIEMSDDGYAGPSVADGRLFIIDHERKNGSFSENNILRAIDVNSGKEAWRYSFNSGMSSPNYGFARSTPTVDGGKVYVQSQLGDVHCVNATDGKPIWKKNYFQEQNGQMPGWLLCMSPLVDGKSLILCTGGRDNSAVVAVDKLTGELIWKGGGGDKPGYATPLFAKIDGKKTYIIFSASKLSGLNPDTGAVIWSTDWQTGCDVNSAMPIVIGAKGVFITSGYGHGCALVEVSSGTARIKWENKEIQSHFNSPILFKGHIYCTSDPGNLVCLDPANGKALWKQKGFEKGGLVGISDGYAIVLDGSNGDLVLFKLEPAKYIEIGRLKPLGGQSWTAPIIADGKLFIRNKETLLSLNLK